MRRTPKGGRCKRLFSQSEKKEEKSGNTNKYSILSANTLFLPREIKGEKSYEKGVGIHKKGGKPSQLQAENFLGLRFFDMLDSLDSSFRSFSNVGYLPEATNENGRLTAT